VKVFELVLSVVFVLLVVGYCVRLQQTPKSVTEEPLKLPPVVAVVEVTAVATFVVTTGILVFVVKLT